MDDSGCVYTTASGKGRTPGLFSSFAECGLPARPLALRTRGPTHSENLVIDEHSHIHFFERGSIFQMRKLSLKRFSNLLKVMQLVSGKAGLQTQASGSLSALSFPSARPGLLGKEHRLRGRKEPGHPGLPDEGKKESETPPCEIRAGFLKVEAKNASASC